MTVDLSTKQVYGTRSTSRNVVGAGGWVTGIQIANDNTKIIRNDVGGVYFRKDTDIEWTPLMRLGDNYIPATADGIFHNGIYDAAIAPTNSQCMAFIQWGRLYITYDGGNTVTWNQAWGGDPNASTNDSVRTMGTPLRYDPTNPNVLFSCTPLLGLQYTLDGGGHWTIIPTSTIPLPVKAAIVFDPRSASGGRCQSIYVWNGLALYWSGDGGATWAMVPGSDTMLMCHLAIDTSVGDLHVIGHPTNMDTNAPYNRWNGSAWLGTAPVQGHSIAISPVTGYIYTMDTSGSLYLSTDNGDNFTGYMDKNRVADRITWHQTTAEWYMANGGLCVDSHDNIWVVEGIGCWKGTAPHVYTNPMTWLEQSVGCENMVIDNMQVKPDSTLLCSMQDRTAMAILKPGKVFPTMNANDGVQSIRHSQGVDWAESDPNFLVCTVKEGKGMSSPNNGGTWGSFEGDVGMQDGAAGGGNIIAWDHNTFLQAQTNNAHLMRTVDGGINWTPVRLGNDVMHWFHSSMFIQRSILIRDHFVGGAGWVYLINSDSLTPDDLNSRGLWRITNKGANLTRIYSGTLGVNVDRDSYHGKLVQRSATELWWAPGDAGYGVFRSTDSGYHWGPVSGNDNINGSGFTFSDCYGVGFGPPAVPGDPTIIYVIGHRMDGAYTPSVWMTYGLWMSMDDGANWVRMIQYPGGFCDRPSCLAADPNIYGRCYIGFPTAGVLMVQFNDQRTLTGGVASVVGLAFDPAHKNTNLVLSNSNHTAAPGPTDAHQGVLGVTMHNTGKWHFAYHCDVASPDPNDNPMVIGIAWNQVDLTAAPWDALYDWTAGYVGYGQIMAHGQDYGVSATWYTGDTVDMCVDFNAGLFWVAKGGAYQNGNPAAGTGGSIFNSGDYWPWAIVGQGCQVTTVPGTPVAGFSEWL